MVSLLEVCIILLAVVVLVPLARRLGQGSILGYLAGGVLIGPHVLGLLGNAEEILHFAEFGVILFLFLVGLELKPRRLWTMRRLMFGMGGVQLLVTALALALLLAAGQSLPAMVVIGLSLALSSTAFGLQLLAERQQLNTRRGRASLAILLFQDLAVAPLLAVVPLLSGGAQQLMGWRELIELLLFLLGVIAASRLLVRPLFRFIDRGGGGEVLAAAALLLVLATAMAAEAAGMSMALGAFVAGVLLADSDMRHQLEADIQPFKSLLLGLFFIAIGMLIDLPLLVSDPLRMLALTLALVAAKGLVLYLIGRSSGLGNRDGILLAAALCQGGEFAFVLLTAAMNRGLITGDIYSELTVVVSLSMAATPLLYALAERLIPVRDDGRAREEESVQDYAPVIIAGFGRVGQIVGRALNARGIPFVALEAHFESLDFVRRYGNKVYYADAGRLDVLKSAGLEQARVLLLALQDIDSSVKIATLVRHSFPAVTVVARARNRDHAMQLLEAGVQHVVRDTFHSSLVMAEEVMKASGVPTDEAHRAVTTFMEFDQRLLHSQRAIRHDEKRLVDATRAAQEELRRLFSEDHPAADAPDHTPAPDMKESQ